MSKWPSVKDFVRWLGLCPLEDESGGKDKGRRRRRRANRAARALRLAAYEASYRERTLQGLARKAQEMGFELKPVGEAVATA